MTDHLGMDFIFEWISFDTTDDIHLVLGTTTTPRCEVGGEHCQLFSTRTPDDHPHIHLKEKVQFLPKMCFAHFHLTLCHNLSRIDPPYASLRTKMYLHRKYFFWT